MVKTTKQFKYGNNDVTIETGEIARQANAAVLVDMDGTSVLVTVVAKNEADPGKDFLPLIVNYQERAYSAGKVPGGYFKREGRPSEQETLISRLIDRPIRPLFAEGFYNEVQVVATVVSHNPEVQPDVPAMIGASAALTLSGLPFDGPISCARVGYINEQFVLNPTAGELEDSDLDLIVAGTDQAVLMVESEANVLSESTMLEAVWYGHEQMQTAINAINELKEEVGVTSWHFEPPQQDESVQKAVADYCRADIEKAYQIADKLERQQELETLKKRAVEHFCPEDESETNYTQDAVTTVFSELEKSIVRQRVLDGQPRIDGRDTRAVRPIEIKPGLLPKTHGSALFTRGETQALVVSTLGTSKDAQIVDAISGENKERFMLHYNFPPYCVGEIGMMGAPKRREIGHGRLAKRGMQAVIPDEETFPYVLRVVSEITESNGSSSMATVCGTSLALMDAGVPIKAPVSGIAMGLVKEGNKFAVLSDILGDEDHLGDMDFKVAGTREGVTALQMDIKMQGITKYIMEKALEQANEGRMHILDEMLQAMPQPRQELSDNAPRVITMNIKPEKVREVIGKGGATIKSITEDTGVNIDLDESGKVSIFSENAEYAKEAQKRIEQIVAEVEVGKMYHGKVVKIFDFGALVTIMPGREGLVHISQISEERVENVSNHLSEGEEVNVKVLAIDNQGRVRLTMKPSQLDEPIEEQDQTGELEDQG